MQSSNPRDAQTRLSQSAIVDDLPNDDNDDQNDTWQAGKLEELKQQEAALALQLAEVRRQKLSAIQSRPLKMGVVGFGRFGQFIARTFTKYGTVVVTSRSDYSEIAAGMGVQYVPLADPQAFLAHDLDVIVFAVSILSFKSTVRSFCPHLETYLNNKQMEANGMATTTTPNTRRQIHGPLMVDVLSVKEHARKVMLESLPVECDILCTHPMFGPDSGKNSWQHLNFVYERTRIDQVVLDPVNSSSGSHGGNSGHTSKNDTFVDHLGHVHSVHEDSEAHVEGMDRMERFLSIWEEEGCRMVPMSCGEHDAYAANSQFVTHLVGRVLGNQGLVQTPIDTSGFESVLKLMDSTTADSFDLFYGLYKYNENSAETIRNLQASMQDVVSNLQRMEHAEQEKQAKREAASKAEKQQAVVTKVEEQATAKEEQPQS